jgi:hypothetical protein
MIILSSITLLVLLGIVAWLFGSYLPKKSTEWSKKKREENRKKAIVIKPPGYFGNTEDIVKLLGFILVIFFGIPFLIYFLVTQIDWGFINSDMTAYPVQCIDSSCTQDTQLPPISFEIFTDQQYVIDTHIDPQNEDLTRLQNCTIKDDYDWQCDGINYGTTLGFTNGKYFDSSYENGVKFVSKYQWDNAHSSNTPLIPNVQ